MACNNCSECSCIPDFGTFDPCGELVLDGITADMSGIHTLKLWYMDSIIDISANQNTGDVLAFPLFGINEKWRYKAQIIDPEGGGVRVGGNQTIFHFKTSPHAILTT